jgi:hypothetical protein
MILAATALHWLDMYIWRWEGVMPMSGYALDTYVAPRLSELTVVGAPDLTDRISDSGQWVNTFLLNTILKVTLSERDRQLDLHLLRKADGAFREYDGARAFLTVYLDRRGEAVSAYFHALRHFETAMTLAYQAYGTLASMTHATLFTKGDGSAIQRLNWLQNVSKHAVVNGSVPEDLSVHTWLTDAGIECHDTSLSFAEFAELLVTLAGLAEIVSNVGAAK